LNAKGPVFHRAFAYETHPHVLPADELFDPMCIAACRQNLMAALPACAPLQGLIFSGLAWSAP
jgi:hypothetical protein